MEERRFSAADCSRDLVLKGRGSRPRHSDSYQGTALAVPLDDVMNVGFSPCSLDVSATDASSTVEERRLSAASDANLMGL
jgi:hypothetical protein